MIRRLRTRHRRIFLLLAAVLPAVVVLGLSGRPRFPLVPGPALLSGESSTLDFGGLPVRATRDGSQLLLQPERDPAAPDVVVIWSAAGLQDGVVIGTLAGRQPRQVALPGPRGRLFLYSLGHDELLGSAELPWD